MNNWGFADGFGNELTRGWRGDDESARQHAQKLANDRGEPVSYWLEGSEDSCRVAPEESP